MAVVQELRPHSHHLMQLYHKEAHRPTNLNCVHLNDDVISNWIYLV